MSVKVSFEPTGLATKIANAAVDGAAAAAESSHTKLLRAVATVMVKDPPPGETDFAIAITGEVSDDPVAARYEVFYLVVEAAKQLAEGLGLRVIFERVIDPKDNN